LISLLEIAGNHSQYVLTDYCVGIVEFTQNSPKCLYCNNFLALSGMA